MPSFPYLRSLLLVYLIAIFPIQGIDHDFDFTDCQYATHGYFMGLFGKRHCAGGSIQMARDLISIRKQAFDTADLTNVDFSKCDKLETIEEWAFAKNKLSNLQLPESITSIKASSFANNKIAEVNIPEFVVRIEEYAFHDNKLTELHIPRSVTFIGHACFSKNKLTSLTLLDNSLETIEQQAFYGNLLTGVRIPKGILAIGDAAFANNHISSVEISDTVVYIRANAFRYNKLINVEIPGSVTDIGDYAFAENPLKSACYKGERAPRVKLNKQGFYFKETWGRCEAGNDKLTEIKFTAPLPAIKEEKDASCDILKSSDI